MLNKKGRFHYRGKSLSSELKIEIIDSTLAAGGDSTTRYFPEKMGQHRNKIQSIR